MRRPISRRDKRTYFNNPLVEESLKHMPAALDYPTTDSFKAYLVQNLHHNSQSTRIKASEYIAGRFSKDGAMDLDLASALKKFGAGRAGREIFYFELCRAMPLLQEIAVRWLAELPEHGGDRKSLLGFLNTRLGGRSADKVAQSSVQAFKLLGKANNPKPSYYVPVWSEPPIEAFLYVLSKIYPERTMVQVEVFTGDPAIRAMLWPSACIPGLLKAAEAAGHISKVSQLDQYHQFTLAGSGQERLVKIIGKRPAPAVSPPAGAPRMMPRRNPPTHHTKQVRMGDGRPPSERQKASGDTQLGLFDDQDATRKM